MSYNGLESMDTSESPKKDVFQRLGSYAQKNPLRIVIFFACLILFIIGLQMILNAILEKEHKPLLPTVMLSVSKTQDVPVYFSAIGTVIPNYVITVRTQVNGTLTAVNFEDGQYVKAGQVLAQIDPRIYQAQVLQYQGAELRDQALLENAQRDLVRYQNLYRTKAVSQQTLNTQETLVKQYQGAIAIDQGQLASAKTNLSYCTITSPVSGRIGISLVDAGNFVQPSDTNGIAVITTSAPISVQFPLPQKDVSQAFNAFYTTHDLPVFVYDQNRTKLIAQGKLTAIDNQVDTTTGTVSFKAGFPNTDNVLFPNEFVNVKMQVTILKNAVVVPTTAIQEGNDGSYVYRYNKNGTVTYVPIKVGPVDGDNTVITAGIAANQLVVVQGADKLFDGSKVVVSRNS